MKDFMAAIEERRSNYMIGNGSPVEDEKIIACIRRAAQWNPSSFHMQSARLIVLFGAEHTHLWEIVLDSLREQVPAEKFGPTQKKVEGFAAGHGTVLYFDDAEIVRGYQEQYPLYGDNFPLWAQQSNGMLQFTVWTLLRQLGLGASLQHYNPLIDDAVRDAWETPEGWRLLAQMPFGEPKGQPAPKKLRDPETLVRVYG